MLHLYYRLSWGIYKIGTETLVCWKQPKWPSADEWIKKLWYIYIMEYYMAITMEKNLLFVTAWVDLEIMMITEVSQTRDRQMCHDLPCMWNLKKPNSQRQKIKLWLPGPRVWWKCEMLEKVYKLPVLRWVSAGDLIYSMVIRVNNNVLYTWILLTE